MNYSHHNPVMFNESIEGLNIKTDGIYVDATFGRGGHTSGILNSIGISGRVIAIDRDIEAVEYAKKHIKDDRFEIFHSAFDNITDILDKLSLIGKVDGVLMDLGVSSPQLDNSDRGFSFNKDGPLDMRMDRTRGVSAAEWLSSASEAEIADVIYMFGEEKKSRKIANAIKRHQKDSDIKTTAQLANIISRIVGGHQKKHPATRSFQAIRIFINQELTQLTDTLEQMLNLLAQGGRISLISFHSIEDRIVKRFIQKHSKQKSLPKGLPVMDSKLERAPLISIGKYFATKSELDDNVRSRSAILRVAEKC
ncbi:MAG TPA: 16S rRNA (cytosine(1402)-N(4))-methyltransferase RsmH [Candidatus Thioglobus sp.]|nr:16S rRNA (cytosine(1402)-N(4))-methyltransferase RsmH [Candidatus Thioglobus sp.]HIL42102.1 16S rRNA (cytosine(1402)-N(4))-methyltransferase RsmH [Gammaproteobacteria bacterium]